MKRFALALFWLLTVAVACGLAQTRPTSTRIYDADGTYQDFQLVPTTQVAESVPRVPLSNQSRLRVGVTSQFSYNTWWLYADAAKSAYPPAVKDGVWQHLIFTKQVAAHGTYTLVTTNDVGAVASGAVVAQTAAKTFTVTVPQGQSDLTIRYTGDPGFVNIWRPGYADHLAARGPPPIFTREALMQLKPFGGFRAMDLTGTNGSTQTTWESRPKFTDQTWGVAAPWEVVIALANATGKDCYINIPHAADDEYIRKLAELFLATCRADVNVYVEVSNECWNSRGIFAVQRNHFLAQARAAIAANDPIVAVLGSGNVDETYTLWRCVARRAVQVKQIMGERFRVVLAGQNANRSVVKTGLEWIAQAYGPPKDYIYAIASAPYGAIDSPNPKPELRQQHVALARQYQVRYLYYEFGFHNEAGGQAMRDAHEAPEAEAKTTAYLDATMADADEAYWFVVGSPWSVNGDKVALWGLTPGTHALSPKWQAASGWAARN